MEWTQIVLAVSISLITGTLIWVGYSTVSLLKELRITVFKTNQILDDTHSITTSVRAPLAAFSEFTLGFKNGLTVFNSLFPKNKVSRSPQEEE